MLYSYFKSKVSLDKQCERRAHILEHIFLLFYVLLFLRWSVNLSAHFCNFPSNSILLIFESFYPFLVLFAFHSWYTSSSSTLSPDVKYMFYCPFLHFYWISIPLEFLHSYIYLLVFISIRIYVSPALAIIKKKRL